MHKKRRRMCYISQQTWLSFPWRYRFNLEMFPLFLDVFMTIWILLMTCLLVPLCGVSTTNVWRPALCPRGCHCDIISHSHSLNFTSLRTVDCTNSHLFKVPVNISHDTQAILLARNNIKPEDISNFPGTNGLILLDLSSNHFYTLEDCRLVAQSLTYLFLEHDELDYLSNRIFTGVLHLQYLSIAHNKIEIIHSDTFDGLHELQYLSLAHNRIFAVNPNWFKDLQTLQTLDVTGNNIHVLWNQGFRFLTTLQTLVLTDNRLNHIYEEAFMGLLELKELFLDNNHLKEISSLPFQYFPSLDILDLSGNHFKQMMAGSFVSVNVTKLRLCYIKELEFIDRHAFVSLPFLNVLDLSNNKALMFIHRDSFHDVTSLEQLLVENGSLLALERGVSQSLHGLKIINLRGNKGLACDCTWKWINDSLQGYNNTAAAKNNSPIVPHELDNVTNITSDSVSYLLDTASSIHPINLSVEGMQNAFCKFPEELHGVKLSLFISSNNISSSSSSPAFPSSCSPRIVPLLPVEHNTVLGEDVTFHCRGIGQPFPRVYWISLESKNIPFTSPQPPSPPSINTGRQTPVHFSESITVSDDTTVPMHDNQSDMDRLISSKGEKVIPISAHNSTGRVRADISGTLHIDYVEGSDQGWYKCVVENTAGRVEHVLRLNVRTVLADVVIVHVSSSSITVTWKSAVYNHDFQLFYKPKGTNDTYKVVDLRPYMRTYTASELSPKTPYEFCIAVKHRQRALKINCTFVQTQKEAGPHKKVAGLQNYIAGGAIGSLLFITIILCLIAHGVKHHRRRRRQQPQDDVYGDNLSQIFLACMDTSLSDLSPVTFENKGALTSIEEEEERAELQEVELDSAVPSTSGEC